MLTWFSSGEGSLPGLQTAAFSLCLPKAERERERERERASNLASLLIRTAILLDQGLTLRLHLTLITSSGAPTPKKIILGVRAPTCD